MSKRTLEEEDNDFEREENSDHDEAVDHSNKRNKHNKNITSINNSSSSNAIAGSTITHADSGKSANNESYVVDNLDLITEQKVVRFCLGSDGFYDLLLTTEDFGFMSAIQGENLCLCTTTAAEGCPEIASHEDFTPFEISLSLTRYEVLFFIQFQTDIKALKFDTHDVNLVKILRFLKFLCCSKPIEQKFYSFVTTAFTASNLGEHMYSAKTMLSLFQLRQEDNEHFSCIPADFKFAHVDYFVLFESEFTLELRLDFCFQHQIERFFYKPKAFSHEYVASCLNIEVEVLQHVVPGRIVLAGGSCLTLYDATIPLLPRSDVDLWCLNTSDFKKSFLELHQTLAKTRRVYRKGCVFTYIAINMQYRNIQVILSPFKEIWDIIHYFDFAALQHCFDGKNLLSTPCGIYATQTRSCKARNGKSVRAVRLMTMQAKGFQLSGKEQSILQHVGQNNIETFLNTVIYVVDHSVIHFNIQDATLKSNHQLDFVDGEEIDDIVQNLIPSELASFEADYMLMSKRDVYEDHGLHMFHSDSYFEHCCRESKDSKIKASMLKKLSKIHIVIVDKTCFWVNSTFGGPSIFNYTFKYGKFVRVVEKPKTTQVVFDSDCMFFVNGIQIEGNKLPTTGFKQCADVYVYPTHCDQLLSWACAKLYLYQ